MGPPTPGFVVRMSSTLNSGSPAGNMLASRPSAMLHGVAQTPFTGVLMITGGKDAS
jgi:hypothetical protein